MMCVTNWLFMLSIIILNVVMLIDIMLNVVAAANNIDNSSATAGPQSLVMFSISCLVSLAADNYPLVS